ncbi:putative toxin-antitoxin system toxin component, PIN family [Rhodoferax fermentans]|uniref:Putative toxin-antitoxin system toxin component, PIN family n=1 Tax=Rhodoferax fermentans TaxID=28066 RepID=A0A1T1ARD0_RHOFE|nr:putative toxin-antitoxin system toxin component, PIN family [Rhodoferax fermentans]MBK1683261.1 putative toxin-antitoxin system toxin component, PIN family [Rhodoferax fermentans]OOV06671.1 putative toxin-antitoxin system toxin component, PIN family [Rhodoferax fermentans]
MSQGAESQPSPHGPVVAPVVLDTNIVLDLLLFQDPATLTLRAELAGNRLQWIATVPMRDELARVLTYPYIVKSLQHHGISATEVLAGFDAQAQIHVAAPRASAVCKDADDQIFIDLAVDHQACLLSKDKAVLCMKKRLLALSVKVLKAIE